MPSVSSARGTPRDTRQGAQKAAHPKQFRRGNWGPHQDSHLPGFYLKSWLLFSAAVLGAPLWGFLPEPVPNTYSPCCEPTDTGDGICPCSCNTRYSSVNLRSPFRLE